MPAEAIPVNATHVDQARVSLGLSRTQFYRIVGCDPRTGVKILRGGPVSMNVIRRVATALNLPIADVIDLRQVGKAKRASGAAPAEQHQQERNHE